MIRRDFIRLASLTAGALPFVALEELEAGAAAFAGDVAGVPANEASDIYKLFVQPENRYRPMVRWWWNGDRVTADEVLRELDVMQAAGIGGVEINPIRFPADADPMDTTSLIWMSDAWIEVLEVALRGTKERSMTCDIIVGSGWPYGGEFLSRQDQTQMVALGTKNLTGPQHVRIARAELLNGVSQHLVSSYKDSQRELYDLRLVPFHVGATDAGIHLDQQPAREYIEFDLPAGDHVLYFIVKLTGFMAVINGAPGATGPVLNHYSREAVTRYLDRLSTKLSAKIGPLGEHFRAFFTDSIELEGANWCDDMLAEFRKRRGYDLAPWLPFVLFKVGEMGNAVADEYGAAFSPEFKDQTNLVRYDFETTKHELFSERFIETFAAWCKRNGVKSRMQAYGMDCDAINTSMLVDIPECETWIRSELVEAFGNGDYRQGRSYTMINKFVSSAAHLSGKRLVSCEEMTNTDDPFHASLERIKVAGDQSMLSGVTQSVLHGFNYSPLSAPFPGWVRYGTYFSERNTWWPFFKRWADYKARLSALFQNGVMQADIAILPASADLAAQYGFQRDPFPKIVDPPYLYKIWEVVHQNGSGCDYLNEDVVGRSTVKQGKLMFGDRAYKAIILVSIESIQPGTAKTLKDFVESGGKLICIDKVPSRASGYVNSVSQSEVVHKVMRDLLAKYPLRTPVVKIREEDMVGWYRETQEKYGLSPDVWISKPVDYLSQLHYVSGDKDIFFFSHYGPQAAHTFEARFKVRGKRAWLWNPESGSREPYPSNGPGDVLSITLGPSESKLIVFEPHASQNAAVSTDRAVGTFAAGEKTVQTLPGPWTLKLVPVDGVTRTTTVDELADLSKREEFRAFAGTLIYSSHFEVKNVDRRLFMDLGHLHSVSQVEVNGHPVGTRWYGVHQFDLSGVLVSGTNTMTIKVVTTLGNYMKTLVDNKVARAWTENTPFYPLGLTQPVRLIERL